jgi:serine/threonine-protein kinase
VLGGLSSQVVTKLLAASGSTSAPSLSGGRGVAPLFIDQLLRFTREHGGGAPARLADLIALRVERLPPHARRALQAIAVFGDESAETSIQRMLEDSAGFPEALAQLRAATMIDDAPTGGLRTSHPMLRDVVLATIPAAVRRTLHARAAEIAEDKSLPLEVRAYHEYQGRNTFQALILLESVGARCTARGDVTGTIAALRRCLELARREVFRGELDDPLRAVLIFSRKLGEALAVQGDFMDAEGVLREALDLAGPSGEDRARVLGALAHVAHGRDRRLEAQIYLREALDIATRSGAHDLLLSLEGLKKSIAV